MFGASAVYMPRLPYLAKLQGVLETYRRQRDHEPGLGVNPAVWERFQAVLRRIETGTEMDQIQAVNAFFNRVPYESDETTYGTNDYWATPYEFLSANAGDCEDYAIAKLLALQEVGVEPQRLRLVIVRDEQLKRAHVVVTALVDGRVWILDNLTPTVVEWHMAGPRYRPLYSVNGSGAWLYRAGT